MREIFESIILGIVQGATEFIPVSSSGHLVIVHEILGTTTNDLFFDIMLHLGTLCAVLIYFFSDVRALIVSCFRIIFRKALPPEKEFVIFVAIATLPAVIFGIFLSQILEDFFRSSFMVSLALIAGSILMWVAERSFVKNLNKSDLTNMRALIIGFFQALALIPGISRSGSTISGGMLVGLTREKAVRLSFLMSIPIIFGAVIKSFLDLDFGADINVLSIVIGLITSFGVGLASIHFLIVYLKHKNLSLFIWYRVILAILILAFFFF